MDVTRTLDPEKKILYTTITGQITLAEIRADMMRLTVVPGYSPEMPGLVDMRGATAGLTSDELRQIAETIKANPEVASGARRALLVSSDLMYGLYRMFAAYMSDGPNEYRVFRDEKQALEWLEEGRAQKNGH
ncbi:MAG TPA: STAS/SEC14 domain-containing protein [Desulfuromonadaceae bacterium]|nr:STAS/SEC14 domain-containing protein [Desulfuromonadaceae bacterium]